MSFGGHILTLRIHPSLEGGKVFWSLAHDTAFILVMGK